MNDYDHGDALRFRAEADHWQKEANALRAELAAAQAEAARYKALWDSVPWNLLSKIADLAEEGVSFLPGDTDEADRMIDRFNDWFNANAPKGGTE